MRQLSSSFSFSFSKSLEKTEDEDENENAEDASKRFFKHALNALLPEQQAAIFPLPFDMQLAESARPGRSDGRKQVLFVQIRVSDCDVQRGPQHALHVKALKKSPSPPAEGGEGW